MQYRLQSALEYVTTYAWAILIIAIALAVLILLGVFSTNSGTGSYCIPTAGYSCSNPTLNTSGYLSVAFSEYPNPITITGTACVANTTAPSSFLSITPTTLASRQVASLLFLCPISAGIGTHFIGTLWIEYDPSGDPVQQAEIGTVSASVSTTGAVAGAGITSAPTSASASSSVNSTTTTIVPPGYTIYSGTGVAFLSRNATFDFNVTRANTLTVLTFAAGFSNATGVGVFTSNDAYESSCTVEQLSSASDHNESSGVVICPTSLPQGSYQLEASSQVKPPARISQSDPPGTYLAFAAYQFAPNVATLYTHSSSSVNTTVNTTTFTSNVMVSLPSGGFLYLCAGGTGWLGASYPSINISGIIDAEQNFTSHLKPPPGAPPSPWNLSAVSHQTSDKCTLSGSTGLTETGVEVSVYPIS